MLSKGVVTLKSRTGKCYKACNIHCDVFLKEIKPYRTRLFYVVSVQVFRNQNKGLLPDQLKSQVPSPVQIFIFKGGEVLQTNIPEILQWDTTLWCVFEGN